MATAQVSQVSRQRFEQSFEAVLRAESAGATNQELSPLVMQLNKALELEREALTLTNSTASEQRVELVSQADQILLTVKSKADQLEATSARRTYDDGILNYAWALVSAILGTLVYSLALPIYEDLRVRRTFQMRVRQK